MYKSFVNTGLVCLNIYDNFGWVHSSAALCTTLASFVIGESRTQREKLGTRFLTDQFMTLRSHKPGFIQLETVFRIEGLIDRCIVLRAKGMGLTAKGTGFLLWAPTTLDVNCIGKCLGPLVFPHDFSKHNRTAGKRETGSQKKDSVKARENKQPMRNRGKSCNWCYT